MIIFGVDEFEKLKTLKDIFDVTTIFNGVIAQSVKVWEISYEHESKSRYESKCILFK